MKTTKAGPSNNMKPKPSPSPPPSPHCRQQAALVVNRKEKFLGELDVLKEQKQKLEGGAGEQRAGVPGVPGVQDPEGGGVQAVRQRPARQVHQLQAVWNSCRLWNPVPVMEPPAGYGTPCRFAFGLLEGPTSQNGGDGVFPTLNGGLTGLIGSCCPNLGQRFALHFGGRTVRCACAVRTVGCFPPPVARDSRVLNSAPPTRF